MLWALVGMIMNLRGISLPAEKLLASQDSARRNQLMWSFIGFYFLKLTRILVYLTMLLQLRRAYSAVVLNLCETAAR
jgi:hypothetical protein